MSEIDKLWNTAQIVDAQESLNILKLKISAFVHDY